MKKSILIIVTLLFTSFYSIAQKGILLNGKENEKQKFLKENTRIKLTLNNGQNLKGRFQIVDDQTISINDNLVNLDSVVMFKQAHLFKEIASVVLFVGGTVVLIVGISALSTPDAFWGFNLLTLLIPHGIGMLVTAPFMLQKERKVSDWNFKIIDDYKSTIKPIPNPNLNNNPNKDKIINNPNLN
jgi:hypothetical protein